MGSFFYLIFSLVVLFCIQNKRKEYKMKLTKKQRETIEMLTKVRGPIVDMYKLKVRTNNKSANRSNKINTVTVVFESTIYEVTSGGRIE